MILLAAIVILSQNRGILREAKDYLLHKRDVLPMEVTGIIAFFLAVFPYFAVFKFLSYVEWFSRHQLLLPLGFALLAGGALSRVQIATAKPYGFVILTVTGIILWQRSYADFYVDWLKQESIIEELKRVPAIRDTKSIIWVDLTTDLDALDRIYRIYDYTGIFNRAYGTQDHYIVSYTDVARHGGSWSECVKEDQKYFNSEYDYLTKDLPNPPPPPKMVIVSLHPHIYFVDNHMLYAINMTFLKLFYPDEFNTEIKSLISIQGPFDFN